MKNKLFYLLPLLFLSYNLVINTQIDAQALSQMYGLLPVEETSEVKNNLIGQLGQAYGIDARLLRFLAESSGQENLQFEVDVTKPVNNSEADNTIMQQGLKLDKKVYERGIDTIKKYFIRLVNGNYTPLNAAEMDSYSIQIEKDVVPVHPIKDPANELIEFVLGVPAKSIEKIDGPASGKSYSAEYYRVFLTKEAWNEMSKRYVPGKFTSVRNPDNPTSYRVDVLKAIIIKESLDRGNIFVKLADSNVKVPLEQFSTSEESMVPGYSVYWQVDDRIVRASSTTLNNIQEAGGHKLKGPEQDFFKSYKYSHVEKRFEPNYASHNPNPENQFASWPVLEINESGDLI